MSDRFHAYEANIVWIGNTGSGTSRPNGYSKNHEVRIEGKHVIEASSDPAFAGDPSRYNPEELLVAALSQCHMLWYLSRCAKNRVVVTAYEDATIGTMIEHGDGAGEFTNVTLHPRITLADPAQRELADSLHEEAHRLCFIARSVNFPVQVEPEYLPETS